MRRFINAALRPQNNYNNSSVFANLDSNAIITLFTYSFSQTFLSKAYSEEKVLNVGLSIVDFEYKHPDGKKETVTAAIWYPTQEVSKTYTYYQNRREKVESKVAVDSAVTKKKRTLSTYPFCAWGIWYRI